MKSFFPGKVSIVARGKERVTLQPFSAAWITYLHSSPVSVINRSRVPSGPRTTALKILYYVNVKTSTELSIVFPWYPWALS